MTAHFWGGCSRMRWCRCYWKECRFIYLFIYFNQKHTRFTLGFLTEEKKQTKKVPVILHSITSRATAEPLKDWLAKHQQATGHSCCWPDHWFSLGSYPGSALISNWWAPGPWVLQNKPLHHFSTSNCRPEQKGNNVRDFLNDKFLSLAKGMTSYWYLRDY